MYFRPRIFIIYASNLIGEKEGVAESIGFLGADIVFNENDTFSFAYQQGIKKADFILFITERSNIISSNAKAPSLPREWASAMKIDVPKCIYIKDTNFIKLENSIKELISRDDFTNEISIFSYETTIELVEKIKSQTSMIFQSIAFNQFNAKYLPRENIQKLIFDYDDALALELIPGMDELQKYESEGDIDFVRTDILSHYLSNFDALPITNYEIQYFVDEDWNTRLKYFLENFKSFKKIQNESFEAYGEPKTLKLKSIGKVIKYRTLKSDRDNKAIRKARQYLKDSFKWYGYLKSNIRSS
ncbi:hypothetical protein CH378_18140 [Leptospira kmetyi]|uniref:Uncharacterized protein n=2 Tax=Leptospira kmetyi TaxID=408139 RepID=A0ABX4N4U0_9LEPT|nr:hypothetical protein CH378_18140 [Leptospira kmetyi]